MRRYVLTAKSLVFTAAFVFAALMDVADGADHSSIPAVSIVDSSGTPVNGLDLWVDTFLGGRQEVVVAVRVSPPPSQMPLVTWSSSDPAIVSVLGVDQRFASGMTPEQRQSGGTYLLMNTVGYVTITAHIGPPYDRDVSAPVYADQTINLGCRLRYTPGVSFEPLVLRANLDSQLDYYLTAPPSPDDPFDQCRPNTPYSSANGRSMVHFPGGGVVVASSAREFRNVSPDQWRNAGSDSEHIDLKAGTLLFKTRDGRIVKTDGFRLVESLADNSAFPDTVLLSTFSTTDGAANRK